MTDQNKEMDTNLPCEKRKCRAQQETKGREAAELANACSHSVVIPSESE
jgi:hypothetical protein